MILWLSATLAAATVDVVPELRDALIPGHLGTVLVAVSDGTGAPDGVWPGFEVDGAVIVERERLRTGVWRVHLQVQAAATQVRMAAGSEMSVVPVGLPRAAHFSLPERVDASTSDGLVTLRVEGERLPQPQGLGVWTPEGDVVGIERQADALLVRIAIPDQPVPRIIPVGIRDLRHDEGTAWTRVHLRSKVPISIEAEPGASLTLEVSGRTYGPFDADARGDIDAVIDQYPGESAASGRIVDDLGNISEANLLLGGRSNAVLAFFAERDYVTDQLPPLAHLFAATSGGTPLVTAPRCVAHRAGEASVGLTSAPVTPGHWMVALPASTTSVQVTCVAPDATTVSTLVPRARSVPRRLRLRVAPVDLRADLPRAEVRAELEDGLGDPMTLEHVEVTARYGSIALERRDVLLRAEYDGSAAVLHGGDQVIATYRAPPGEGPAHALEIGWGLVPSVGGGSMEVYARAVDSQRRALVGVPIRAEVAGRTARSVSGDGGWARFTFEVPRGYDPVVLIARIGSRLVQHVVHRSQAARGGPSSGDMREVRQVRIQPGRIAAINVDVEPTVLKSGPGAVARIQVNLEDESGQPVVDEDVAVRATEGTISELTRRADGTWSARYEPSDDTHRRTVRITAATSSLKSSTQLVVERPAIRASVGPWVGLHTTFGARQFVAAGIDVDLRSRRNLVVRLAGQVNTFRVSSGRDEDRSVVVPLSVSLLLRDDRGPWGWWGGAGAAMGPHLFTWSDQGAGVAVGSQIVAGPALHAGVARLALGGEVALNVRYMWLAELTSGGAVGFDNVGGLSIGVGYRLVY